MIVIASMTASLCFGGIPINTVAESVSPDCRFESGPCSKTLLGITMTLDITPKPLRPMRELTFTVLISDQGRPITDAFVTIALTMPSMFMGKNIIMLAHSKDGIYEGKGVIVRCPSGEKIWKATVTLKRDGGTAAANYVFEVP